jgi:hypothetical protein
MSWSDRRWRSSLLISKGVLTECETSSQILDSLSSWTSSFVHRGWALANGWRTRTGMEGHAGWKHGVVGSDESGHTRAELVPGVAS